MSIDVKKKYNILMIAPTMFFADYGCHVRILEEATILRDLGHRVTILAYPNGRDIANLDVYRCFGIPLNYRVEVGSSRHKIYLDVMLGLKGLHYILKNKPDIIHGHLHEGGLLGWILSKLTGAPLIFDFQGSLTSEMLDHNFIKETSLLFKPLIWLEKQINHIAKVILTSSKHSASLLENKFDIPAGKIYPTPDCVNPDTFSPTILSDQDKVALKNSLGIPLHKQLIVYAGLLTEYQGTGILLESLKHLKTKRQDFHLLLMGFPSVAYYQERAHHLQVADLVTFTGKMPYEDLPAYLALGDIAIAPKLSATEGNGKILNYMSMALPTIVFKTPVSQEYLGHYGIYAQVPNAISLAQTIVQTLEMSSQSKKELGDFLRQTIINNYTWSKIGIQIEMVYDAVLAGHPQPAWHVKQVAT